MARLRAAAVSDADRGPSCWLRACRYRVVVDARGPMHSLFVRRTPCVHPRSAAPPLPKAWRDLSCFSLCSFANGLQPRAGSAPPTSTFYDGTRCARFDNIDCYHLTVLACELSSALILPPCSSS